jgi:hypothetical protein
MEYDTKGTRTIANQYNYADSLFYVSYHQQQLPQQQQCPINPSSKSSTLHSHFQMQMQSENQNHNQKQRRSQTQVLRSALLEARHKHITQCAQLQRETDELLSDAAALLLKVAEVEAKTDEVRRRTGANKEAIRKTREEICERAGRILGER